MQAERAAIIDTGATTAYRLVHGAADGWPGWYLDRLGDFLLSQSSRELSRQRKRVLQDWIKRLGLRGAYHKKLRRDIRLATTSETSPTHVLGDPVDQFFVRENGLRFLLNFREGYSVGLFLDQRENRRRLLTNRIAKGFPVFHGGPSGAEVLNTFAYTCAFSVCAAKAGARVVSLDLSRKYLEWGRENFRLNGLDPAAHDFIHGDAFDWMRRLAKKNRKFDLVLLDPPTFSKSKQRGIFQAERDYGALVKAALPLLKPGGVLFASTNAAKFRREKFVDTVTNTVREFGRAVGRQQFAPQPRDFPSNREEPPYLKALWLHLAV